MKYDRVLLLFTSKVKKVNYEPGGGGGIGKLQLPLDGMLIYRSITPSIMALVPTYATWENSWHFWCHHWFPRETSSCSFNTYRFKIKAIYLSIYLSIYLETEHRNSVMMTCHYPDVGSALDWLDPTAQPNRSATTIWVVPLIGWTPRHGQTEALPWSGYWHIISMEFHKLQNFTKHVNDRAVSCCFVYRTLSVSIALYVTNE